MKVRFLLLTFWSQYTFINCLLLGPANSSLSYPRRNLTCSSQSSSSYNGTTTYQPYNTLIGVDYCVVIQETILLNGLPQVNTNMLGLLYLNEFRNMAIN